jgi:hypothetical protein
MQHLVRLRWEELNPEEHKNFAKLSIDLMYEIADPCEDWALKSQTAALVAEVFTTTIFIYIYIAYSFVTNCNFVSYKTIIGFWYFDR